LQALRKAVVAALMSFPRKAEFRLSDGSPQHKRHHHTLVTIKKFMDISVVGEERRIVADDSASIRLFFAFSDGVKHSDMRKVYVDLLCGRFTMLCAFFVYHNLGYKGSSIFLITKFISDKTLEMRE
jgi:hypothetical protein